MFADDTKIWCKITQQMDSTSLQNDLIQLQHWTDKWSLKLNPEKYARLCTSDIVIKPPINFVITNIPKFWIRLLKKKIQVYRSVTV